MKEQIERLQMVKNTLGMMIIQPTQQNTMMLAGVYQYIDDVMNDLQKMDAQAVDLTPALKEEDL